MSVIPGIGGAAGLMAGGTPRKATFAASSVNRSISANTTTFSAFSIGSPASNRYVAVMFAASMNTSGSVFSVTVGGVSCTQLVYKDNIATDVAIFVSNTPIASGSTADVVISVAGAQVFDYCAVATYALTGFNSYSAIATGTTGTNGASMSLINPAGGIILGVGFDLNQTATMTVSGITKDAQINGSTTNAGSITFAHGKASSGTTNVSFTASATTRFAGCCASLN